LISIEVYLESCKLNEKIPIEKALSDGILYTDKFLNFDKRSTVKMLHINDKNLENIRRVFLITAPERKYIVKQARYSTQNHYESINAKNEYLICCNLKNSNQNQVNYFPNPMFADSYTY